MNSGTSADDSIRLGSEVAWAALHSALGLSIVPGKHPEKLEMLSPWKNCAYIQQIASRLLGEIGLKTAGHPAAGSSAVSPASQRWPKIDRKISLQSA
jgi:hypothetical protein